MSKPIIEVRNLSKRYRLGQIGARSLREEVERLFLQIGNRQSAIENLQDFWALKDVSFDVQPGEVLGIIGRNGAGKSTLLKILSRITEPTSGEAILRGRVASLLEVGTGFHPELTGRENVYLNGAILGMKKREIDARFDEIVAFAEMAKHIDTPVKRYSSGQRVRLAFAVAAHLEAEILIVDEVLAVGDAAFQQKCTSKMKDVSGSGRTVLFVSHQLSTVQALCEEVVVISNGRLVFRGATESGIAGYVQEMRNLKDGAGSGTNSQWIERVEILLADGKPVRAVPVGQSCVIRCLLRFAEPVHQPSLGIALEGPTGERVTTLKSDYGHANPFRGVCQGKFELECMLESLPVHPGSYNVRLRLEGNHRTLELLESVMDLEITPSDYLNNGGKYGPGVLILQQQWKIKTL